MFKLKKDTIDNNNKGEGTLIPSPPVDCKESQYLNLDYFGFVVVQTLKERDNIPCKLRQRGMIAVVIEEGFSQFQLQTTLENGVCDNKNWIMTATGIEFQENFRILEDRVLLKKNDLIKEGVIYYIQNEDEYYKVQDEQLVQLFPEEPKVDVFRVTAPVGSLEYGQMFPSDLTPAEALKRILTIKEFAQIINTGSVTLAKSPTTNTVEVGTNYTVTLTATANRGSILGGYEEDVWNKDLSLPYRGLPKSYQFLDNNSISYDSTTNSKAVTTKIKSGTNTYTGKVTFEANQYNTNSENKDITNIVEETLSATTTITGAYRMFFGSMSAIPTNGSQIRTALLGTSVLNPGNSHTFVTNETDTVYVIAIPNNKTLDKVKNAGTNEDLTFTLSTSITTIPDAGGTNTTSKVYILTTTIPLKNQTLSITLK